MSFKEQIMFKDKYPFIFLPQMEAIVPGWGGGGGGGTWVEFDWVCAAGTSEPLPHYSLFLDYFVAKYRPHLSHLWVL